MNDLETLRAELEDASDAAAESRALLLQAIELLQQVVTEDPDVRARIVVWLLARRDDQTLPP